MEAQSIILSINMILSRYEGGWENFKSEIPNDSFCADGKLVRIGFMDPADGMDYLDLLLARGLRRGRANRPADFATVDQMEGFITPCAWAELGRAQVDDDPRKVVLACRLAGDTSTLMAVPDGWEFENSLSQRCFTFESGRESEYFDYLGGAGSTDVYRNLATGEVQWIERNRPEHAQSKA